MIGKIALIMLVAAGMRCQNKLLHCVCLWSSEKSTENSRRAVLQIHNGGVHHMSVANKVAPVPPKRRLTLVFTIMTQSKTGDRLLTAAPN